MTGTSIADAVLAHIGYAERWLRRARADYEHGDLRRVVLRLLLAEAEIRRARESGVAIADLPPRRPASVPWAILVPVAAACLIVAGYALIRPHAETPIAQAPGVVRASHGGNWLNGVVRLDTGQMLPFVGFSGRPGGTTAAQGTPGGDTDRLLTIGDDGPAFVTFR